MRKQPIVIIIFIVVLAAALIYWNRATDVSPSAEQATFDLPEGETVVVVQDGNVIGTLDDVADEYDVEMDPAIVPDEVIEEIAAAINSQQELNSSVAATTIMVTDGTKHSIPLEEILGGGPPKDGIPSIDDPQFVSAAEADFLTDQEPGISVSLNGIDRFYPFQIMVWHEIVNDTFDGQPVLVTYCPLCLTGVVYDPLVLGERVEFGTSGKLWQSNLIMYDRKTDSYWSQVLGEAIVGEMTGNRLTVLPSDIVRFGDWKSQHPNGEVLSRETGAIRFYGSDPYGDYYTTPGTIFPTRAQDHRLEDKDFVLGIVINGKAKAYYPEAIKSVGEITDVFEGITIVAQYDAELDVVRLFEKKENGELVRINPVGGFWFSWVAAYPDTELYEVN